MLQCRGMGTYSQMFSLNEILRAVQASRKKIREGVQNLGEERQINDAIRNYEDVDSWKTVIFLYNAALKEVGTKLEILNDEFQHVHKYNPIEHIKTRIKTPESIVKKLKRNGHESLDREYGPVYQRHCRRAADLFFYVGYLPTGGDDRNQAI